MMEPRAPIPTQTGRNRPAIPAGASDPLLGMGRPAGFPLGRIAQHGRFADPIQSPERFLDRLELRDR